MWERYPPTPPFHCGKLDQCTEMSLINSFRWVQLPLPLPSFAWKPSADGRPIRLSREVIRLPVCKTGVSKQAGSDDWSVTSTSHHFGLVAQPAERPVVCGRVEGATPFESANSNLAATPMARVFGVAFLHSDGPKSNGPEFSARGVAATCSAWNRGIAGASPAALTIFKLVSWPNEGGIRLPSGTTQVELKFAKANRPAWGIQMARHGKPILPAAPLPGGVKVARRPVKPFGVGASPTLAASLKMLA